MVGIGKAARRFITAWPRSMMARTSSGVAPSVSVLRSRPATKMDFLALVRMTPLRCVCRSMNASSSLSSISVRASKMFADEPGRSKVSTQTPSSPMVRRTLRSAAGGSLGVTGWGTGSTLVLGSASCVTMMFKSSPARALLPGLHRHIRSPARDVRCAVSIPPARSARAARRTHRPDGPAQSRRR